VRLKKRLWRPKGRAQLESLTLAPWASRRRQDLLRLLDQVDTTVVDLSSAIEQEAKKRPEVTRLMTHPGVGALTALAFVLIIGTPERFARSVNSPAIWAWSRRKTPAANTGTWATSPNKETRCCAFCWSQPRRSRCAPILSGGAGICT
jgi:hypothetical protein